MVFDVDHDFEGPRAPKAHLGTVLTKPVTPPAPPPFKLKRATQISADYHPEKKGRSNGGGTAKFYWHSDLTIPLTPPMGAYLSYRENDAHGMWACTRPASL